MFGYDWICGGLGNGGCFLGFGLLIHVKKIHGQCGKILFCLPQKIQNTVRQKPNSAAQKIQKNPPFPPHQQSPSKKPLFPRKLLLLILLSREVVHFFIFEKRTCNHRNKINKKCGKIKNLTKKYENKPERASFLYKNILNN